MALANYTDLQASVADFLNREDLTSVIPDFIVLAEARLNRTLRTRRMVTSSALTIDAASEALPTDFLEVKQLLINDSIPYACESASMYGASATNYQRSATPGKPVKYSIVGANIEFVPPPDATYSATLTYYQKIPDLATNSTNWLLTQWPDLYLYSTLLQAAPYLKDDDRILVWEGFVSRILSEIELDDQRAQYNASPLSMRPRRAFG